MAALQWLASSSVVESLGWTLVHSLWEGFACMVLLAVVLRAMRGTSASARYLIAAVGMVVVFGCAIATFGLLNRQATPGVARADRAAPVLIAPVHLTHVTVPPIDVGTTEISVSQRLAPMLPWLVLIWGAGVIALGIYQLGGWIIVRRLRHSAQPTTDACAIAIFDELIDRLRISRPVQLGRSVLVQVPTVIGWIKPVVLLPINALTGLTTDQLRGLLAHELAHVRRHDYLANIIQVAIETVLFYHPAVWWIGKVIRQERENACDDLAAAVCDRATYAQALAKMETLRQSPAMALSARGGVLLPRIRRILGISNSRSRRGVFPGAVIAMILVAITVSLVIFHTRPSHADEPLAHRSSPTTQLEIQYSNPTPDDLTATSQDYQIGKNDLLSISINDLQKPGSETVKQTRISESGKINLPFIGEISVAGSTEIQAQKTIADAYEKAMILKPAIVSVQVLEARNRTFSILGAVQQPGQYAIPKSDFRLLDALVLAHDVNAPVASLLVLRQDANQPDGHRNIQIPFDALRNGNTNYNIVIHADDLIIVKTAEQDDDPTARKIWQVKQELSDLDLSLKQLSQNVGEHNPRLKQLEAQRDQMLATLRELRGEPPASQPAVHGEYYISGVPRTGVYSVSDQTVNLRQALAAAGYSGNSDGDWLTLIRPEENNSQTHRSLKMIDIQQTPVGEILVKPRDVLMVGQVDIGVYLIGGDVPRGGAYSLTSRQITPLEALIAAGADPNRMKNKVLTITRRSNIEKKPNIFRFTVADLIDQRTEPFILAPNDWLNVSSEIQHLVHLIIGKDQWTFEGKPIHSDELKAELEKVPDRENTVIDMVVASNDVTYGQQSDALGLVASLVQELGFKYVTQPVLHSLGSKADDEAPTTAPAGK